ncbi:MAG: hypothetical protein ABIN68_03840 [Sphingomicrobium sp.]
MPNRSIATDPRPSGPPTVKTLAERVMVRETRVAFGPVAKSLSGDPLRPASWQVLGDEFLLRGEGDHYFHYRLGEGITIERGHDADLSEEALWLNGTVYAAIASLNGLLPIHASAVALEEHVFAFTGPAGAGKSTLVAALGDRGLPMFCDDTLVLDLSDPDRIICLPGHKRMKLTPGALQLTGATREKQVSRTVDKCYASPQAGDVGVALPLARLIFLEVGERPEITPITGSERFVRMQDDHQTAHLFAAARQFDRAGSFAHLSRLARQIVMARFARPHDVGRFAAGVAMVEQYITEVATEWDQEQQP